MLRELKRERIQRLFIMAQYERGWGAGCKRLSYCVILHFVELFCG